MQTGIAASSINSIIASAAEFSFAVEADDEAGGHEKTRRIELVNALGNAAPCVLLLAHRNQRRGIGTLDADEDSDEIGPFQQRQEFGIVGEIKRRLSRELEGIVARLKPLRELGQECLDRLLVADEVVVDEIDMAAIAQIVQCVELRQHLGVGLGARHAAVKLNNVAKLAGERTAARELHANMEIIVEFQKIEARDRRLGDVGLKLLRLELAFARACIPRLDETVDDVLGFTNDAKIGGFIEVWTRCDARAANDDRLSASVTEIDDIECVALLRQHPAGKDHIGPIDVVVGQFFGVAVHQPDRPGGRQ